MLASASLMSLKSSLLIWNGRLWTKVGNAKFLLEKILSLHSITAYLDITASVAERMREMREKKFSLQPEHLVNTYAVEYASIGSFIKDVSLAVDQSTESSDHETKSIQSSKLRLLLGASIVSDIRRAVKEQTGYTCSAGIAHNKILAKLCASMNKPNKQTLLPIDSIPTLFKTLEIKKIKGLGAKAGEEVCSKLDVKFMGDLLPHQETELQQHFGPRIGSFLFLISRGIDLERVERKVMNKCIAVSKNFRGKNEIFNVNTLKFWIKELSKELKERLERDQVETNRVAKQMTVQFTQRIDNKDVSSSRTVQLNGGTVNSLSLDEIVQEAFNTIEKHTNKLLRMEGKCILNNNIKHLGIGAAKLEEPGSAVNGIQSLLKKQATKAARKSKDEFNTNDTHEDRKDVVVKPWKEKPRVKVEEEVELSKIAKFNKDCLIKGEKTLKHWLLTILNQLNEDIKDRSSRENAVPKKIQLLWRQLLGNDERSYSETIPLEIFTNNSIKAEFFLNIMRDSSDEFTMNGAVNSISSIEMKAIEFQSDSTEWNLMIENDAVGNLSISESDANEQNNFAESAIYNDKIENCEESEEAEKEEDVNLTIQEEDGVCDDGNYEDLEEEYLRLSSEHDNSEPAEVMPEKEKVEKLEETAGPSYMNTYAEFHQNPIIEALNPLEECLECGRMIRKLDMLTHLDGHIAMQISLSQREEYRAEQKKKFLSISGQKSMKKTLKSKPSQKNANVLTSIERFTKKTPENIPENHELCRQCNEFVLIEDWISHQDHHFAQKLRMDQLKAGTHKIIPAAQKRKRPVSSGDSQKTSKTLKTYFAA
jgi:nucleotidyltransferase/DNA polymerase involved in DNA repair